ncbi:MAG: ABC transporter ATP-binding protein/permease [Chloroflexi bacterium]|nr:ABC transporter ATP-binding protein/permease [Chloroflexota bacterium]MBU1748559.1 ABC transporter ATP-binding protein/permease [Chloroflexota bacterium]MBU1878569.1 ABC transporter ATP-binding protein/permease [Chloroflexota bacterium]
MQDFKRLLIFIKPYWKRMLAAFVCMFLAVSLGMLLPWVVQNLVDVVFVQKDIHMLTWVALALVVAFALQSGFDFLKLYLLAFIGERVTADMRVLIYEHLQELSLRFYADRRVGELVSRVTNDVNVVQGALTGNVMFLLQQLIILVAGVVILFVMNPRLTLLILLVVPIMAGIAQFFGNRIKYMSITVQEQLGHVTTILEETLAGIRVVKSFVREDYETTRFSNSVQGAFAAAMERTKIRSVFMPMISFAAFGALVVVLWYGGREVIDGALTAGALVAYLLYAVLIASPVQTASSIFSQFQEMMGASHRIFELLDARSEIIELPSAPPLPRVKGRVTFEDVVFSYDTRVAVLDGVSLIAEPGQVMALVGPSGSGKTTLVSLLPRFYDPNKGTIRVDGHDIRTVQTKTLRDQIGIVPQDTLLFGGTIRENIAYGRLDAMHEEIVAAAVAANAHDFIMGLPDGYETQVGERGANMSVGQRQRVSIARAILKNPRILILDEATSSLDSESEAQVQEALERLMEGRTTFVIAHRLSTIHNADQILVLNEGRIVEQGTHEELMTNSEGLYYHLHSLQFALNGNSARPEGRLTLDEKLDKALAETTEQAIASRQGTNLDKPKIESVPRESGPVTIPFFEM